MTFATGEDTGIVGDGITNKPTPKFAISGVDASINTAALAASNIKIFDNGSLLTVSASNFTAGTGADAGKWFFTPNTAFANATNHSLTVTQTVSGLTSVSNSALSVSVDTSAPAVPVVLNDTFRYVMVRIPATGGLDIAEVKVMVGNTNVAKNANVLVGPQGTYSASYAASFMVNDVTTGNFYASANSANNAWVQIDLGSYYSVNSVNSVQVTSRTDGYSGATLNNAYVLLSPKAMATSSSDATALPTLLADSTVSKVQLPSNYGNSSITNTVTYPLKTASAAPTLTGTGEAGARIDIFDTAAVVAVTNPSGKIGSTVVKSDGTWSFLAASITYGNHSITTTQTDVAGTTSASSSVYTIALPTAAPLAPALTLLAADDTGTGIGMLNGNNVNYAADNVTSKTSVTIQGTSTAGDTIQVFAQSGSNYTLVGTATVAANGTWSLSGVALAVNASTTLVAKASNAVGSSGYGTALTLTNDNVAPAAPTVGLAAASDTGVQGDIRTSNGLAGDSITLSGTAEPGALITIKSGATQVNATNVYADANGSWASSLTAPLSTNAANALTVTVTDQAGNVNTTPVSYTVTHDNTAPSGTLALSSNFSTGLLPTVSGTGAEAGAFVDVYSGADLLGSTQASSSGVWSLQLTSLSSAGSYNLRAQQRDAAGNVQTSSTSFTLTVADNAPIGSATPKLPNISLLAVDDIVNSGDHVTTVATPRFTGTGAQPNATVQLWEGNVQIGSTIANGSGDWILTPSAPFSAGLHDLSVVQQVAGQANGPALSYSPYIAISLPAPVLASAGSLFGGDNVISWAEAAAGTATLSGATVNNATVTVTYTNASGAAVTQTAIVTPGTNTGAATWTSRSLTPANLATLGAGNITVSVQQSYGSGASAVSSGPAITSGISIAALSSPVIAANIADNDSISPAELATGTITGTNLAGATAVTVTFTNNATGAIVSKTATINGTTWTVPMLTAAEATTLGAGSTPASITMAASQTVSGVISGQATRAITLEAMGTPTTAITVGSTITGDVGSDGTISSTETPTFSGAATTGASVTVVVTNTVTGASVTLNPVTAVSDSWTAALTPAQRSTLGGDKHPLQVTAIQNVSGVGVSSASRTFVIDTVAPAAPSAPSLAAFEAAPNDTAVSDSGMLGDNITRITTPTITGKANPGVTVNLYSNLVNSGNTIVGTGTSDGNGNYSIKLSTALTGSATGTVNSIIAKQADLAGNESAASTALNVIIDSAVAVPAVTTSGALAATPMLSGTGEAGATVDIFDTAAITQQNASGKIGSALVNSGGNWSFQASGIISGSHTITTQQTDVAGNKSATSSGYTFTVDATAMGVPVLDAASDSGTKGDNITNVTAPTLKGMALTAGGQVEIYDNNVKIATVTATGSSWSYTPTTALTSGAHSITAKDVTAGKTSGALSLSIDTSATAPVIAAPTAANTKVAPVISGTGAEAGATITLTATPTDGTAAQTYTAVANASGAWRVDTSVATGSSTALAANKTYTLRATQTDATGNTSALSAAQTVSYDTVALAPTVKTASATVSSVFALSGEGEAGATVRVYDGTILVGSTTVGANGNWAMNVTAPASASALRNMTVVQTDLAGNQSAATAFTRTVDLSQLGQALLVTASDTGTVGDGITSVGAPNFTGSNATAFATVQVFDTVGTITTLLGSAVANAQGVWTLGLAKPLTDGGHVLQVKEVDSTGAVLRSSAGNTVVIDTRAPDALTKPVLDTLSDSGVLDGITNATQLAYSGTAAEALASIKLFAGGNQVGSTISDSSGAWRITTSSLTAGSYNVAATQTDAAGNVSAASAISTVWVDNTIAKPTVNTIATQGNNPVISGTAEALSTVRVTVDQTTVTTQADVLGAWKVQLSLAPTALTTYTAVVQASDLAGNVSTNGIGSFSVDPALSAATLPATLATPTLGAGQDTGLSNSDGISNITKPVLSGTGAVGGATVQLLANGVQVASTTAKDSGDYSFTASDYTSALSGSTVLSVVQVVGANAISSQPSVATRWMVDNFVAFSNAALTRSSTDSYGTVYSTSVASGLKPTLTGSTEAGASVKVFDNGAEVATVTANSSGMWTYSPSALSAGSHSITTQVTDVAGNVSITSQPYVFKTLTTAPTAPSAQVQAGGDSGASSSDGVTNVTAQTFRGTVVVSAGQDAPSVSVYDNGTLLATVQADSTGAWSYSTTLVEGGHLITARAKDLSGNLSAATTVARLAIDTTAPVTPAAPALANGQDTAGAGTSGTTTDGITRFTEPVFTGTAEAGATVELYDNGTLVGTALADASTGAYTISASTALAQGGHNLTVQAVDLAGNRSAASAARAITVDSAIGGISFLSLASGNVFYSSGGEVVTKVARPTVQGYGEAGATVTVYNNTGAGATAVGTAQVGPAGFWSLALTSDLVANNNLTAQQTDKAGNTSAVTSALSVAYNSAAILPTLALQTSSDTGTVGDGITARSTPTLTGTDLSLATKTVTLYNGNDKLGTGVADSTGKWAITVGTPLADNTALNPAYTLTAKEGTTALGSVKLKIDSQPDAAPTGLTLAADSDTGTLGDNLTSLSSPVITGSGATAGATVRLLEGSTLLGQGVADSAGHWRVQSATLTSGAPHSLTAVQVDVAGNVSNASSALVLTVDTAAAAPSAPVLSAASDTGLVGDNRTSQSSVSVSGQGAEANAWVSVYNTANGLTTQLARVQAGTDGSWSAVLSNLAGSDTGTAYSLTARQTDDAGNTSTTSAALALVVDSAVATPSVGLLQSASNDTGTLGDGRTQNTRPVLTGTAEAGATVQVLRDDGNGATTLLATVLADASTGAWTWQPSTDLGQGRYRYLISQIDVAGNVSTASQAFTLTIVPSNTVSLTNVTGAVDGTGGQLADFNNDGLVDVMVNGAVYTQTASSTFVLAGKKSIVFAPINGSFELGSISLLADVNNDGLTDVLGVNTQWWVGGNLINANVSAAHYRNAGSGAVTDFVGTGQVTMVSNGGPRLSVANGKLVGLAGDNTGNRVTAVYDVNADGYLDLVYAAPANSVSANGVLLSKGDGTGMVKSTAINPDFSTTISSHITTIDLNNDGVLDVFNGSNLYQGLGNGRYATVTSAVGYSGGHEQTSHVVVADINGDGWQDLLVGTPGESVKLWLNRNGVLSQQATSAVFDRPSLTISNVDSIQVSARDVNGDRSIDMLVAGPGSDVSLSLNTTAVAENTYLRVEVANSNGNETLSAGATVSLYDSVSGTLVATQLVGNNVLGAFFALSGVPYAEFFGLDPAKTYDVVVRYPGNDQGVTVVTGKSGLGTSGIAGGALKQIVDSQLTAVSPGGKDVITVAPENRSTATNGGNWGGTRYADSMVGDAGDDTFTPNGSNVGEAGDTIDLSNGGHDRVVFNTVLNLNSAATISGFALGSFTQAGGNGDAINVSGLLSALGYTGARDATSLAYSSGTPTTGMLKVDPGTNTADLMLRVYNGSGWQDLALIKGAGLTGKTVSDLIASGNLQLGQLGLGGTTPAITLNETDANTPSALYSDLTVLADGGAFSQGFASGSLQVTLGDAYAEDTLSLVNTGLVTVSGSKVSYNNVLIGTVDSTLNGSAGKALHVNFSFAGSSLSKADQATAVQAVARAVRYQNTGDTPPDYYRDLTLQVSDGETTAKMVGQLTVTPQADTNVINGKSLVTGSGIADTLTGTTGDDTVVGYGGPVAKAGTYNASGDTMTGGGGHDTFVYRKGNVGMDTITDFGAFKGQGANADIINLTDLLQGFAWGTSNINDFVRAVAYNETTVSLQIDYNGKADGSGFQPYMIINLPDVAPASMGVIGGNDALVNTLVARHQLVLSNEQLSSKATALTKIVAYANSQSNPAPDKADYAAAGVTDVSDFNVAGLNAAVVNAGVSVAQDAFRVQELVYPNIAINGGILTANYCVSSGVSYQWQANGVNIAGANSASYTPTTSQQGSWLSVVVSSSANPSLQFGSPAITGWNSYVLAATGASDTATDNVLSDGGLGSLVQLSQLSLSPSQQAALQSIKFTSLTNLKLFSLATAGDVTSTATDVSASLATTILSLADLTSGKYLIKYSQSDEQAAGRLAAGAFTVTPTSGSAYNAALDIVIATNTGAAVWGDESGFGGRANSNNNSTVGAGAGGTDMLLGTSQADIMFGDGSGGGAGGNVLTNATLFGGAAGGGADTLFAGMGDDILFGDGFAGTSTSALVAGASDGGYGGGGGGAASRYLSAVGTVGMGGVGAGAGGDMYTGILSGGSTTLGFFTNGTAVVSSTEVGVGAGVSADGNSTAGTNYVAELDRDAASTAGQFNNTGGTVASTVKSARAAFLTGTGSNMFNQTMGAGNDVINGGAGNDYIMGGNGNDTITGGQGNDIMYGRGGGTLSGTDNDSFVWQRGDAGSAGALDIIRDFTPLSGGTGDRLDLTQLLEGYTSGTSTLANWVTNIQAGVRGSSLVDDGVIAGSWDASQSGTLITLDVDGTGSGTTTQKIFLAGVTLSTDLNALMTSGVIVA